MSAAAATTVSWVERFRPSELSDLIPREPARTRKVLERFFTNKANITPNLLLLGPPGCGKTTLASALARHYFLHICALPEVPPQSIIYLNVVSGAKGGDAITRHDCILRNLLSTQHPFCPNLLRFVILDEVEALSRDAQRTLKDLVMLARRSKSKLRFILLSNFEWQILPELQHAVLSLRIPSPSPDIVRACLRRIMGGLPPITPCSLGKEPIVQSSAPESPPSSTSIPLNNIENEVIERIVRESHGDMRAAIHALQHHFTTCFP